MAISLVNFSSGAQQGGPFTTITSVAQNVSSGNTLVAAIRWIATNFTDNAGNRWNLLPALPGNPLSNLGEGLQFAYCNNCVGNSALQVTATFVSTSQALDTYNSIAVWQIGGGPLTIDSYSISSASTGSTQTYTQQYTKYPNTITCLFDIATSNLATYGVNSPLTQDGGTSLQGQQISSASHVINTALQPNTSYSMTSSINGSWEIAGLTLGLANSTPSWRKRKSAGATSPLFTGRLYASYITLERLF
jgi:hypothetical protein